MPKNGEKRTSTADVTVPSEWTAGLLYFLRLFVRIRWGAAAAVAVVVGFAHLVLGLSLPYTQLYSICCLIVFYNVGFILFLRKLKGRRSWPFLYKEKDRRAVRIVARLQINLDYLALFGLLFHSGGAQNPFVLMFVFHVVVAAILLGKRWALVEAGVATFLIFALVGLSQNGMLPLEGSFEQILSAGPSNIVDLVMAFGWPSVITITIIALFFLTTAIVGEYARRRKMVVELSQNLEDKNRQLEELDEMRKGLLTVATHDMKSPLATIGSYLKALDGGYVGELEDAQLSVVKKCITKVDDLNAFISDVLSFQSIDRGELRQSLYPLEAGELLAQIVDSFAHRAREKDLSLKCTGLSELPRIQADEQRLTQVFSNLVSNAIKYTNPKGSVEIIGSSDGSKVKFEFRDSGVGIGEEDLEKVFGEFFRSKKVRSGFPGTGMGLAIVRKILEAYGGRIWATSELDVGSSFFVELDGIPG